MDRKHVIAGIIGGLALVVLTAGASAWVVGRVGDTKPAAPATKTVQKEEIRWNQVEPASGQAAPAQPACDDDNIVGMLAGGAAGGLAGSQVGSGNGKTAATIGGAVGGAYLGKEYLATRNVTCR